MGRLQGRWSLRPTRGDKEMDPRSVGTVGRKMALFRTSVSSLHYRRGWSCDERQPLSQSQRSLRPMGGGKEIEPSVNQ
jgi:hypothetical protein